MSSVNFGFAAKEIIEEGCVTEEDLQVIKSWTSTQRIPKLTDEQIVLFLLSCSNDREQTKKTIASYYSIRKAAPKLFDNRLLDDDTVQLQLKTCSFCVIPERCNNGSAVLFFNLKDKDYKNIEMLPALKIYFMVLDSVLYDHPPNGVIIVVDFKGVGLMHLTKINLGLVKISSEYLQRSLPLKLKKLHVLNSAGIIDKLLAVVKPFLTKETSELINFHHPDMDMNEFYEKCVPKRCLPQEYGGDAPSIQVLHDGCIQKLIDMQAFFKAEESQRHLL